MTYSFHPEARAEFKEATIYYFEKSPSLGAAFYSEVEKRDRKDNRDPGYISRD